MREHLSMKLIITDHHWDRSFSAMNFLTLILARILKKNIFSTQISLTRNYYITALVRYGNTELLQCLKTVLLNYCVTVLLNYCVTRYCITELLYYHITELLYYWINSLNCWTLVRTLKQIWIAGVFLNYKYWKKN